MCVCRGIYASGINKLPNNFSDICMSFCFSRRAPPGKCKYKPVPVKIKSKRIPFVPRASKLFGLNFTKKQNCQVLRICD